MLWSGIYVMERSLYYGVTLTLLSGTFVLVSS